MNIYSGTLACSCKELFMYSPMRTDAVKLKIPKIKSGFFFSFELIRFEKPENSKEKPTWPKKITMRNNIPSNNLNLKSGGLSQNGSVVPIRAGSIDAVQYCFPANWKYSEILFMSSFKSVSLYYSIGIFFLLPHNFCCMA